MTSFSYDYLLLAAEVIATAVSSAVSNGETSTPPSAVIESSSVVDQIEEISDQIFGVLLSTPDPSVTGKNTMNLRVYTSLTVTDVIMSCTVTDDRITPIQKLTIKELTKVLGAVTRAAWYEVRQVSGLIPTNVLGREGNEVLE